jgi:signal transduction histidine kinase/FixJ family two-component response regulator
MDHREFPILYLDDEPENLRIFELTFRRDFSILTAETGEEALRLLHENPVAIILTDYRMPAMNGVEFLAKAREIDDRCIRMLVTAYGDVQILGDAINDGRIYGYIPKPWEPEQMKLTLCRAIESYAVSRERSALLEELTLLNRLSNSLHRELDLGKLLALVLDATHNELGFDGAAVMLMDADDERLSLVAALPDDDVARRLGELEISRTSAPGLFAALEAGETQSLVFDDMSELDAPVRAWVTEVSAEELIVVPLMGKTALVGLLAVDQRAGGRRFGADDRTLLDGLAIQIVIGIANARLVEDLRSTREQVRRGDRLGTLGTLAAGLAHEINNPLVSIHTFLSLAPEKRTEDDPQFWGEYYALARAELERIRGLVATMSRLARGGHGEVTPELVSVGELAAEVVKLVAQEAKAGEIDLQLEVATDAPQVNAVRDHLHQVLLNLVVNALHATAERGRVKVAVRADPDRPQEGVCVSVEDTGVGIPEENIERIFDPFFTTKEPDEGTGLGLMITHQIVADHGGSIEVTSEAGRGSCFRVKLPVKGVVAS